MVRWVSTSARVPEYDIVDEDDNDDGADMNQLPASKERRQRQKRLQQLTDRGVRMLPVSVRPIPVLPAPLFQYVVSLLSLVQWLIIAICILNPLRVHEVLSAVFFGHSTPAPAIIQYMNEKRWPLVGLAFFVGNMLKGAITSSSAFEVFLGDSLVFSALEAGRTPNADDLVAGLERAGAFIVA